uniref:Uncharacterized protein n=1 Tax=Lepeophtheirus salmonis TaxID=72036 RepID=A0A0K2TY63_LEPSM
MFRYNQLFLLISSCTILIKLSQCHKNA